MEEIDFLTYLSYNFKIGTLDTNQLYYHFDNEFQTFLVQNQHDQEVKDEFRIERPLFASCLEIAKSYVNVVGSAIRHFPHFILKVLSKLRMVVKAIDMKYVTLTDFIHTYTDILENLDKVENTELLILFDFTNWMNILLRLIPANKHKGFALDVIAQFVEGSDVAYVTGSGQKLGTRNRVRIYQHEGSIIPYTRKRKNKDPNQDNEEVENVKMKPKRSLTKKSRVKDIKQEEESKMMDNNKVSFNIIWDIPFLINDEDIKMELADITLPSNLENIFD